MSSVPCATCPWRKENTDVGGTVIPGFSIDKARGLACTVGDDDWFRTIMACHGSLEGAESPCVGYLAVEGWSNLSVRLAAMQGRIPLNEIVAACANLDLHESFDDMLAALEAVEHDRRHP